MKTGLPLTEKVAKPAVCPQPGSECHDRRADHLFEFEYFPLFSSFHESEELTMNTMLAAKMPYLIHCMHEPFSSVTVDLQKRSIIDFFFLMGK